MNELKDRYCFIHLPKSAGTSLLEFLRAVLGEPNVLHFHASGAHAHAPLEYLITRYRAIVGHFEVADLSDWMFENVFIFTFLRDPVDRVLSNYHYYRNVPHDHLVPEMQRARELDLPALLRECDLSRPNVWSNWQTFALSGLQQSAFAPGTILEPAKRTLTRLDFVGFYESLHADVQRLCQICGWDASIPLPVANVTPERKRRGDLDPETLELIRELNRDDLELYECAKILPSKPAPDVSRAAHGEEASISSLPPGVPVRRELGTREIFIRDLTVRAAGLDSDVIAPGGEVEIQIDGESTIDCADFVAGIRISDSLGFEVYGTNILLLDGPMAVQRGQRFTIVFSFPAVLGAGNYYITVAFHSQDDRQFHWIDNHSTFEILPETKRTFSGSVNLRARMRATFDTGNAPADSA